MWSYKKLADVGNSLGLRSKPSRITVQLLFLPAYTVALNDAIFIGHYASMNKCIDILCSPCT